MLRLVLAARRSRPFRSAASVEWPAPLAAAALAAAVLVVITSVIPTPVSAQVDHWKRLRPGGRAPQALQWATGVYDSVGHRMLVFGGTDQNIDYNTVWSLELADGSESWSLIRPYGQAPMVRRHASAGFDRELNRMIIFGGYSDTRDTYLGDTWIVDFTDREGVWEQYERSAKHPTGRRGASMIRQRTETMNRLVLFGGYNATSEFNDVWAFDMRPGQASWAEVETQGSRPPTRDGHTAIYDAQRDRMVVYSGWNRDRQQRTLNDTWELDFKTDPPTWSAMDPGGTAPPMVAWASADYDPCAGSERMLVFGGYDGSRSSSHVWSLTLDTPGSEAWTRGDTTGARPTPRDSAVMVYDPRARRLVVFSGWDGPGDLKRDIWELELTECEPSVPSETPALPMTDTPSPTPTYEPSPTLPWATATATPWDATPTTVTPTATDMPTPTATRSGERPCADEHEPDDMWFEAKLAELDTHHRHTFDVPGDVDYIKFVFMEGRRYRLTTLDLGQGVDTRLYLYDTDGTTQLAWNDDDPSAAPASLLEWEAGASGTYFAKVSNLDPTAGGCDLTYSFLFEEAGDPGPTATRPPRPIEPIFLPYTANHALRPATATPAATATMPGTVTPDTPICDPGFESGRFGPLSAAESAKLDPALLAVYERLRCSEDGPAAPDGAAPHASGPRPSRVDQAVAPEKGLRVEPPADARPDTPVRVVIITRDASAFSAPEVTVRGQVGTVVSAVLPADLLDDVARMPEVVAVRVPAVHHTQNDLARADARVPEAVASYGLRGRGVTVGILDSGIDFTHPAFIDGEGKTRIKALLDVAEPGDWDCDGVLDGSGPLGGTLYTEDDINRALEAERSGQANLVKWQDEPLAITDSQTTMAHLDVPAGDSVTIQSLHLQVDLWHWDLKDLQITLVSPDGGRHLLPAVDSPQIEYLIGTREVAQFVGNTSGGSWTLEISDSVANDDGGELVMWALHINRPVRQEDLTGHGTHVAGSAAGGDASSGEHSPGQYGGVAPDADLLIVQGSRNHGQTGFDVDDLIPAIQWLDASATALGQPYVANFSWGRSFGPHDGTDPTEVVIDGLVGPGTKGKAVVTSAGNTGDRALHASGHFGPGQQSVDLAFDDGLSREYIDLWFEGPDTTQLGLVYPDAGGLDCVTADASWGDRRADCDRIDLAPGRPQRNFMIYDDEDIVNYGFVRWADRSPLNGLFEVRVNIRGDGDYDVLVGSWQLLLDGGAGRWDAWSYSGETLVGADNSMSVDSPSCARHIVAVGSHTTRLAWTDVLGGRQEKPGTVGAVSVFSSRGPTRDNRSKPELTAAGEWIVSALSTSATAPDSDRISELYKVDKSTSMAAPQVSGAIAVLMSAPGGGQLDVVQIRQLLQSSARRDAFTGSSPDPNDWGAGKLDVLSLLQEFGAPPASTATPTSTVRPSAPTPGPSPTPTTPPIGDCWRNGGEIASSVVGTLDDGKPAHAGRYSALLGDPNLGDGAPGGGASIPVGSAWVEQTVEVPDTAAPTLSFWYRMVTYDVAQDQLRQVWDIFAVYVDGEMAYSDGNRASPTPGQRHEIGWKLHEIDLGAWRGQTVVLRFANWNGHDGVPGAEHYNTWTYLDDVYLLP